MGDVHLYFLLIGVPKLSYPAPPVGFIGSDQGHSAAFKTRPVHDSSFVRIAKCDSSSFGSASQMVLGGRRGMTPVGLFTKKWLDARWLGRRILGSSTNLFRDSICEKLPSLNVATEGLKKPSRSQKIENSSIILSRKFESDGKKHCRGRPGGQRP